MATVLKNGILIDGLGQDPISNGFVVIKGDKIEAVGPLTEFDPAPIRSGLFNPSPGSFCVRYATRCSLCRKG